MVFQKKKLWSYDPIGVHFTLQASGSDKWYKLVTRKITFHGTSLDTINRNDVHFHLYKQGYEDIEIDSKTYWDLIDKKNSLSGDDDVIVSNIVSGIKKIGSVPKK